MTYSEIRGDLQIYEKNKRKHNLSLHFLSLQVNLSSKAGEITAGAPLGRPSKQQTMKISSYHISPGRFFALAGAVILLFFNTFPARAQFYFAGDDPWFKKWYSIESENYKVIYPRGLDSLARGYARELETYRKSVGLTSGYIPGDHTRGKMPVVLHAYNSVSNGSVAWAPKRLDAYTLPQMYNSEAHPWVTQLAVHESRHISQMQFGLSNAMRPFNWIIGEMWNGLSAGIYTENSFLEGDAVVCETELTRSGRGRKADFLNYYMVCFDQGDLRDWNQWRFGSQKNYTPDYYALGYLTYGGLRWLYDIDDYTATYLDYASRHPIRFDVRDVIAKHHTGKDLVRSFPAVRDSVTAVWKADAEKRRPYMPMQQLTLEPRKTADYEGLLLQGDNLYAIKSGYNDNYQLVRISLPAPSSEACIASSDAVADKFCEDSLPTLESEDSLKASGADSLNILPERFITHFGSYTGPLKYSPATGRIYWSESIADARWTLKYTSKIRSLKEGHRGKHSLTRKGWLYNPAISPDGRKAAVVELRTEGGSRAAVLDSESGKKLFCTDAPDSLQLSELAWVGEDIYATAISANGFGIYRVPEAQGAQWEEILAPSPVQIKNFQSGTLRSELDPLQKQAAKEDESLLFTSDRTGVNELYRLCLQNGKITQVTSTRYGASDYQFDADGNWLYYSSQTIKGKMIFRTAAQDLPEKEVNWNERYSWPIADKLSEQARRRAEKLYGTSDLLKTEAERADTMRLSAPKRYHKFPQMFRVHSWAPCYINFPALLNSDALGDNIFDYINLGATAVIQNQLGTFSGIVGYSAHTDKYASASANGRKPWRHSAHLNLTYSGLYPVFELNIDFNDRAARQSNIFLREVKEGRYSVLTHSEAQNNVPNISGTLRAYIPFKFSSGGWSRGFTPSVSYYLSNDRREANAYLFRATGPMLPSEKLPYGSLSNSEGLKTQWVQVGKMNAKYLKNLPTQQLNVSASLYGTLSTTNSAVYPRWGGGLQAGLSYPLGMNHWYSPVAFGYAYGYFPGITREQGLKLTAWWQGQTASVEQGRAYTAAPFHSNAVSILPRGFQDESSVTLRNTLVQSTQHLGKFTADYAIPIYVGDRAIIWDGFYVRRLTFTPHFDLTLFKNSDFFNNRKGVGSLMTYGFDISADFECILWLLIPCSIGVSVNFNGAPGWTDLQNIGTALGMQKVQKFYIGPVFKLSMF